MKRRTQYTGDINDTCKSWFIVMDWKHFETVGGLSCHAAGGGLILTVTLSEMYHRLFLLFLPDFSEIWPFLTIERREGTCQRDSQDTASMYHGEATAYLFLLLNDEDMKAKRRAQPQYYIRVSRRGWYEKSIS